MIFLYDSINMNATVQQANLPKRLYLESYGCQMNEYDSGIVRSILSQAGYRSTDTSHDADLILLNTCAIRERAQERIYGRLASFSPIKRKRPQVIIGILGCMAQNLGDELFAMGLPLDFVLGPDNYRQLPDLVARVRNAYPQAVAWNITHLSRDETYEELQPKVVSGKLAFLTIMRGCDNFCSFCVVPYTRGRERSRSPYSIITEIQDLIENEDVREVTLLGQNVNSYHWQGFSFCDLITQILEQTTIERIRFTSPHPHDFPQELLTLMAHEERFCSQIHLPLQSGSSTVLKRMKRDYNREEFLALVDRIRNKIPEVGLTTDVIVGFCGETQDEFAETLSLMQEVGFDMAYMFRYSERNHTWAKKHLQDDVPEEIKLQRLDQLIKLQQGISREINKSLIGKEFSVLVEGPSRRSSVELMGRTLSGKAVVFPVPRAQFALTTMPSNTNTVQSTAIKSQSVITEKQVKAWMGRTVSVRIEQSSTATLRGEAVAKQPLGAT